MKNYQLYIDKNNRAKLTSEDGVVTEFYERTRRQLIKKVINHIDRGRVLIRTNDHTLIAMKRKYELPMGIDVRYEVNPR